MTDQQQPKVLIFTTIYDKKEYALETFMDHCSKFTYPNFHQVYIDNSKDKNFSYKLKNLGLDVVHTHRGHNSREALARSSNLAVQMAKEGGYDYLMSLESDVYAPPDVIERLMSHYQKVVTGWYEIGPKEGPRVPCITIFEQSKELPALGTRLLYPQEWPEWKNVGLKNVAAGAFGVCLMHMDVFNNYDIGFTYDIRLTGHPDIFFFNSCFRRKIPVWVDTDLYCEHDNIPWSQVEDR